MARLFGLSAVLLGAAAWPAFPQEMPAQLKPRQRIAVVPSPTPTPAQAQSTTRIRRSPAAETPAPRQTGPRTVDLREQDATPAPREARPVRERRIPQATPPRERDPFDSGDTSTPSESVPVRERRIPVEATPPPQETGPVRVRRTPGQDTRETTEATPVRTRRIPVEATPPPQETGPVRVRRTPGQDTREPIEATPVRTRRIPVEATPPPQETGPVRVRRTPGQDTREPIEATPVRTRRIPVEATPPPQDTGPVRVRRAPPVELADPTPVRVRRLPVVELPEPNPVGTLGGQYQLAPQRRCGMPSGTFSATLQSSAQNGSLATIIPPAGVTAPALPGSVTLRPGSHGDLMKTLPALRQIPASVVRGNSILTIGKTRFDFKPMVQNPKALVNIAQKLRQIPDQVDVCVDILEATEVPQGLIVHSVLGYVIRPGGCRDAVRRRRIAESGVNCFTKQSDVEREAGFSNPANPHYVRDPRQRLRAVAAARAQADKIAADIDNSVAGFRAQIADPAQRAQIVAEFGDAEVNRLEALDDEALAGELANSAESVVEQVAFMPTFETLGPILTPLKMPVKLPYKPPVPIDVEYDIGNYTFLTGFTLGKEYQWKQRVETTIKWCLVGCKKTYYAELFAGFSYGFGLRFPIRFGGTYNPKPDADGKARLKVRIAPINGNVDDYRAAGLEDAKLFDGKELVAEVSAYAGVSAKLPIVGQLGPVQLEIGKDFTDGLTGDLAHGQFTPPTPGVSQSNPEFVKVFDDFDLIGGRANFGVFGGQVFPAVKVTLNSEKMNLTLHDTTGGGATIIDHDGQDVPLAIKASDKSSTFRVDNPVYNLKFNITPGITARAFIDLAVWGTHWDWPIWFPQLAIDLPPGGVDFSCHAGTVCSRDFRFNQKGSQSQFDGDLEEWAAGFTARWMPKCLDAVCRTGVRLIREEVMSSAHHSHDAYPLFNISQMKAELTEADKRAYTLISESSGRKSEAVSNAMAIFAQGYWTPQCKDAQCFDEVNALAAKMGPRGLQLGKAYPTMSTQWINQQVNKEYAPQFQKAIDDSKVREKLEQSFETQRQLKKQGGLKPIK
ncbi:MAG: hypothetical protein EOP62_15940 [Sphingomonadales bacterium]|nr:MAG: hypothetical protein EOP62_15940 [Sphingomonadales bacterium]